MLQSKEKIIVSELQYRPGVGMMIINKQDMVFVARRADQKRASWQMPQGGIEKGETPSEAVVREMKEEIGCDSARIIAESSFWYSYDLPETLIPKFWNGKYRGQRHKWFLLRFYGKDDDINLSKSVNPEFSDWKWIKMEEVPKIAIHFKRKLYHSVVKEFSSVLSSIYYGFEPGSF